MHTHSFLPCTDTARRNDRGMHEKLLASLSYLADTMAVIDPTLPGRFEAWSKQLSSNAHLTPDVFGGYYDIVSALEFDHRRRARRAFERILLTQPVETGVHIRQLQRDHARTDARRIRRFMGSPETGASGVRKPRKTQANAFATQLDEAFNWIEENVPDMYGEVRALIREVTLVGPEGRNHTAFEGGTCFRLWGALVLNAERDVSVPDLITTLAHESGHAALFGFCQDEMLVENPDSELHWSPIRQEKRPLEGIFHAAFVSARMVWVIQRMLESEDFDIEARLAVASDLEQATNVYQESAEIIRSVGKLTQTGSAILASTEAFMSSRPDAIAAE